MAAGKFEWKTSSFLADDTALVADSEGKLQRLRASSGERSVTRKLRVNVRVRVN